MTNDSVAGLTVVLTGGSSGIGAAAARRLAGAGASLVVVGRSARHTHAVADATGATALVADFARFDEVRGLAKELLDRFARIDVLVNNAGMVAPARQVSADGHELSMQVNFLSPFLLTALLLERLAAAPAGRVVNTSSSLYRLGRLDPDDLDGTGSRWSWLGRYNAAKLAAVAHAAELNRRTAVTAAAFHPGTVRSGLDRGSPLIAAVKSSWLGRLVTVSPEQGAGPLAEAVARPRRDAFLNRTSWEPLRPAAADPEFGARLWQRAAEAVGITADRSR
jgi:NAD(P)-dependent dehydrogenase (short-subunit alcohol dehydrogenase family)